MLIKMLVDLPIELQHMIIASLASHELLTLRTTCSHLLNICDRYIMKRIIDAMRDGSTTTSYLHNAVEHSRHNFLQRLLSFHPPVNSMDALGDMAMHKAVRIGCVFCVRLLLHAGADPVLATVHGWSPLMLAARYGHDVVAEELLRAGAEPNLRGFHGWTALHLACAYRHSKLARVLKGAGADQNIVDNDGIEAKEASCGYRCWGVWRWVTV